MQQIKALCLHLIELVGGFSLMRAFKRNDPLILMYHRIIDNQFVNALTPQEFERQIIYIQKHFNVMPIEQLLSDVAQGKVKPYSIALTFDDGHYDFYFHAWPILKKYNLPASIYVTTGFVDGTTWLWPDLLKYILLSSNVPSLNMAELGAPHLGSISNSKEQHYRSWHKLGDYCLTLNVADRDLFLNSLANQAQVQVSQSPQAPFHSVTWRQLKEMHLDGLDVGSHTVTHPILSSLREADLNYELKVSAKAIEKNLGISPKGICYPNGRPEDINDDVIKSAQTLGYTYGLMGRNSLPTKECLFKVGRLAANKNFFYFKWTLARRKRDSSGTYIQ